MLAATIHDAPLIATIAVSLAVAFVGGLVAVRLLSIFIASLTVLWWPHGKGKSTANSQPEAPLAVR